MSDRLEVPEWLRCIAERLGGFRRAKTAKCPGGCMGSERLRSYLGSEGQKESGQGQNKSGRLGSCLVVRLVQ